LIHQIVTNRISPRSEEDQVAETLPLIPEQRQRRILELLSAQGVVSIHALTEDLGVSAMTVRRDIANLEAAGQVQPVTGGVRLATRHVAQPPNERRQRETLGAAQKRVIAEEGARLVEEGMTIFLDGGTTCEAMVPHLAKHAELTVLTSDLHSGLALMAFPQLAVILAGGELDPVTAAMGGPLAAATVAAVNFDVAFISTGAWSKERGVMAPALGNVEVKNAAMKAACSSVLVADSSKYGAVARFRVAPLEDFAVIVTDDALAPADARDVSDTGVDLRQLSA
jgi:DeoR/GlpR family transcriptional regulator of sugar metabolism